MALPSDLSIIEIEDQCLIYEAPALIDFVVNYELRLEILFGIPNYLGAI